MFSEEINNKIRLLYQNEPDLAKKLLSGNPEAIRSMTLDNDFTAETVAYALSNNRIEELKKEANRRIGIKELYHVLCEELTRINLEIAEENKRKSK